MKEEECRNAHQYILRPQSCTGQRLWHAESNESDPGWEGLYFADALIGGVFPAPRHLGRWKWICWLGLPSGGVAVSFVEARAALHREIARRPVSEVTAIFE